MVLFRPLKQYTKKLKTQDGKLQVVYESSQAFIEVVYFQNARYYIICLSYLGIVWTFSYVNKDYSLQLLTANF